MVRKLIFFFHRRQCRFPSCNVSYQIGCSSNRLHHPINLLVDNLRGCLWHDNRSQSQIEWFFYIFHMLMTPHHHWNFIRICQVIQLVFMWVWGWTQFILRLWSVCFLLKNRVDSVTREPCGAARNVAIWDMIDFHSWLSSLPSQNSNYRWIGISSSGTSSLHFTFICAHCWATFALW